MAFTLKKRFWQWLPVGMMFILLLISMSLLNMATQSPEKAGVDDSHFYLSLVVLALLTLIILFNLGRVFYQWHTREAGSRFTVRLMTGFLILTLLPVLFVSLFAVNLIGSRVDRWFSVSVERALGDSLELSQLALATRGKEHVRSLENAQRLIQRHGLEVYEIDPLLEQIRHVGASEVVLLDSAQNIVGVSMDGVATLIPQIPSREAFRGLQFSSYYYKLDLIGDELFSRVAVPVVYGKEQPTQGVLTALFPVSEREQALSDSVANASSEYNSLLYQRDAIRDSFRLSIIVIMVLTALFSLWAAFVFSRRLTRPVRTLVEGTLAVAAGDLEKKLPVSQRDDFSLLASSFNTMTKRLSEARREREDARRQLQQEHDYLHVVLEHLSSGVITLDNSGVIRRINTAAGNILRVSLLEHCGQTLPELRAAQPELSEFLDIVQSHLQEMQAGSEWQAEISLNTEDGRLILLCRGAALPAAESGLQGFVLVFDDITDLIQAEHDAAWSEVARRLAHEIKNPLTPIQLSAERLERKLSRQLDTEGSTFLKRMTNTIVQQVDNLKSMVNAFSEYARAPSLHIQAVDLNILVREVAELYGSNANQLQIDLQLEQQLPTAALDINRIRQLLVNLIKNALEALEENQITAGKVIVSTAFRQESREVVLSIRDNGPGIAEELLPRLFEPYVTSKHKGTGLGLAIVKKIVEEHAGYVSARNHDEGGAIISIRFPLS